MILGYIGDSSRNVARFESDPRADVAIDTVAEGADLDREVVREIVSSETLNLGLQSR